MTKFQIEFKRLRQERQMTQADLSKALGLSRSTIGMYEQGQRTPDYETLELIADFFNVSITTFFNGADSEAELFKSNSSSFTYSPDEKDIIIGYRQADEGRREAVRVLLGVETREEKSGASVS